ncbi:MULTISPECIES: 2-succinyl-5-enolpyruvyl-6-hydroxy-3-cyclohexene-1-carboxylic-acid synthase [Halorussus]|uniref:2-succinyl-5-enolpyruvyl-6-hydroxy-3- cyclohexene-1-carboxylic-acid synthase n=1 Tax=Halorussus TaxID=1070314 RepID=UPI000E216CDD|nr:MULTISPECIES: 2-succinyl-5-enolpyruvyl-6-hydroxy-3-cyclohexene-1-carboxylic-acid synthase [Halorussus]NHN58632.1 2-succinyl-5-enolpyruvyl-6-hydroxy-3-cyclohexene-1-carboxylic-acid synthase [Halorussus sp. JP-T4]
MSDSPAPNRNTLWARGLVAELAAAGVEAVCVAPGSRSTPLTVAFAEHPDVRVFSHLDERSAAFFALGRAKRTGEPTPLVCTSGTAAANFHPAVIEANRARVPMLVLTADRPPELRDSGANQTVDQEKLYGDAVRWYADLPEPEPEARKLRSLRTTAARAVAESTGVPPGPVHLNVPFRKPLEPVEVEGDVPGDFAGEAPLAAEGRDGPFVETAQGRPELADADLRRVRRAVESADRGLVVAGPADAPTPARDALADLADATGFPVLADPLSGHRFGHDEALLPDNGDGVAADGPLVVGGYDGYLGAVGDAWPDPEVVVRFGASPTSKVLRNYLEAGDARQFLVDPAAGWREASFTATDLLAADPTRFARNLAATVGDGAGDSDAAAAWRDRFADAERRYWDLVAEARDERLFEGGVLSAVAAEAPDPATVMVSNSMPVRDLDRFAEPRAADLTVLGNRGASGIDGITSTGLGAGSATDDPLVIVTGDLAYYHDMNGLLAVARCGVDATVVEVNNDGGGIFHMLPIEEFDPPFTEQFRTPHGLDYEPTGDLYGLDFERAADLDAFRSAFRESVASEGTQVVEVPTDAEASHRFREELAERAADVLRSN